MVKSHDELTEGYWFFRDGDEITIVQLEKPTAKSPLYILWPGTEETMLVFGKPIDRYLGPVPMPGETPPIRLPTALSLMIEKGVDPEQNGYCRVIDVEKFLCAKLGKEWSATGMSIVSLVEELSAAPTKQEG